MSNCEIADISISVIAAFYCLILQCSVVWQVKKYKLVILAYIFVLIGINHIALRYVPDPTHDTAQWVSILVPVLVAALVIAAVQFVWWLLDVIVTTLIVLLMLQYFTPTIGIVFSIVAAVAYCVVNGICGHSKPVKRTRVELAQAGVDVEVELLLPLFRALGLVGEHLELAAHARHLVAKCVHLRRELQHRVAVGRGRLDLGEPLLDQLLVGLDRLAKQVDALARLIVVEQALRQRRAGRQQQDRKRGGERRRRGARQPPHQYSPV